MSQGFLREFFFFFFFFLFFLVGIAIASVGHGFRTMDSSDVLGLWIMRRCICWLVYDLSGLSVSVFWDPALGFV